MKFAFSCIIVVLGVCSISAQDTEDSTWIDRALEQGVTTDTSNDLILLVNAPPEKNAEQLRSLFADAIAQKGSGLTADIDRINAKQITKRNYDDLARMITGVAGRNLPPVSDNVITQDPDRSLFWKVTITNASKRPTGIRVHYKSRSIDGSQGRMDKEEDFKLGSQQSESARFRYYDTHTAFLKIEEDWEMKDYAFMFQDEVGETKAWPAIPRQFFAQIPAFQGSDADRKRFFEILESGSVGEILVNESTRRPVRMVHMDMIGGGALVEGVTFKNNYMVVIDPLKEPPYDSESEQGVERVWVLMPLSESQKNEVVSRFSEFKDPRLNVLEAIRDGKFGPPLYQTFMVDDPEASNVPPVANLPANWVQPSVLIDQIDEPKWFEIGLSGGTEDLPLKYRRAFHLSNGASPAVDGKWQIVVYETKNAAENGTAAFRATLISDGDKNGWWRSRTLLNWPKKESN